MSRPSPSFPPVSRPIRSPAFTPSELALAATTRTGNIACARPALAVSNAVPALRARISPEAETATTSDAEDSHLGTRPWTARPRRHGRRRRPVCPGASVTSEDAVSSTRTTRARNSSGVGGRAGGTMAGRGLGGTSIPRPWAFPVLAPENRASNLGHHPAPTSCAEKDIA